MPLEGICFDSQSRINLTGEYLEGIANYMTSASELQTSFKSYQPLQTKSPETGGHINNNNNNTSKTKSVTSSHLPVDLSSKSSTSSESESKDKDDDVPPGMVRGPNGQLWPAWVFCTRYSDRPSSGKSNYITNRGLGVLSENLFGHWHLLTLGVSGSISLTKALLDFRFILRPAHSMKRTKLEYFPFVFA
jgi:hypothetical protein